MKTRNIIRYSNREWKNLSSILSEEKNDSNGILDRFMAEDTHNTIKYWKELREMNNEKEIDVDKAWNKLFSKISEDGLLNETQVLHKRSLIPVYLRIAAAIVILTGLSALLILTRPGLFSNSTTVATTENQKNLEVTLPDGSNVILNRNTTLTYRNNYGKNGRNVSLEGEAFFEITPDTESPFTVDAGKARIRVLGTSFNVITENTQSEVEVFVKTGKVLLITGQGDENLVLDQGFIGKTSQLSPVKEINIDPNYMSWNTGILIFDRQPLDVVFRDLRKVYNMDIVADDPSILENVWTTNGPVDNETQETVIRLICGTFNLLYTKDGNVYHLSEK